MQMVIGGLPILATGVLLLVMIALMLIVGALVLKMESLAVAVCLAAYWWRQQEGINVKGVYGDDDDGREVRPAMSVITVLL